MGLIYLSNIKVLLKATLCFVSLASVNLALAQDKDKKNPCPENSNNPACSNVRTSTAGGMILSKDMSTTTMLTPTAFGSTSSFAFVTSGGTPEQAYLEKPDMVLRGGVGVGDYSKNVSIVAMVNVNDVSEFRNFSASFIASRKIGNSGSISAGALHVFADEDYTDGPASYYIAYSRAVKGFPQLTPGQPRLAYTIGIGNGMFHIKDPGDYQTGKGKYGTAVFANLSYNIFKNAYVNAEWNGINLGITSSYRFKSNWPSVFLGASAITRYSGDKAMFVFGIGQAIGLTK